MEDWKYWRRLYLTEKQGVVKGIAITVCAILLVAAIICVVVCFMKKGCCGFDCDECDCDALPDDDDFENDEV